MPSGAVTVPVGHAHETHEIGNLMSATSWLVKAYVFGTALQTANGFRASTTGSLAVVYVLWRDLNAAGVPFGDVVIGIVRCRRRPRVASGTGDDR